MSNFNEKSVLLISTHGSGKFIATQFRTYTIF
jgi:hypothetical protein